MFWVLDVTRARQLVGLLALLAGALSIALAGDHGVAATFATDAATGHDQVQCGEAVIYSLGVMLDAARMHEEAGRRRPPHLSGLNNHLRRNTGDLRGILRRVLLHRFHYLIPSGDVLRDELAVDPPALDHQMQHSVEYADVAA